MDLCYFFFKEERYKYGVWELIDYICGFWLGCVVLDFLGIVFIGGMVFFFVWLKGF